MNRRRPLPWRGSAAGAALVATLLVTAFEVARADALAVKAEQFRATLFERHLSSEGMLIYRARLPQIERQLRDGDYPVLADAPTFTGLWAAAACAHAAASDGAERERAQSDAHKALDGLTFLMDVTGVEGLLARSARRATPPSSSNAKWFRGTANYAGYWWRGNVSMDQYANGLLPAVALCKALFPERTRALIRATARHLLRNDMRLVDPDGETTRYGNLGPRAGFGFNAIAFLTGWGVFALAADQDEDPRWAAQRDALRDRHRVVARAKRTNLRIFGITNTSNDLMAWNLYRALVPLARRAQDAALEDLLEGMRRTRRRTLPYGNSYFALVYCELTPADCDAAELARVRAVLEAFPSDKRKLAKPGLEDVPRRWLPGRKFERLARAPVPIELRPVTSFEWKSTPYRTRPRVDPETEYSGLDYLVAYWLYLAQARIIGVQERD